MRRPSNATHRIGKLRQKLPDLPPDIHVGDPGDAPPGAVIIDTGIHDTADVTPDVDIKVVGAPAKAFAPIKERHAFWWERLGYGTRQEAEDAGEFDPDTPSPASVRRQQWAQYGLQFQGHRTVKQAERELDPQSYNAFAEFDPFNNL
jgi:hypothetical protein